MRKANVKNEEGVRSFIERRLERLKKVNEDNFPPDADLHQRYREKITNASEFTSELNYLLDTYFGYGLKPTLVPKSTFYKLIERADFATIELDDEYCKVCTIHDYLLGDAYIIYIAPLEKI